MPKLYIAEKPSLGRAIAAALPSPQKKGDGYIECANGDIVTWCIGHLLEQVNPDAYDKKYKKWRLEDLPIQPEKWLLSPRKTAENQLKIVKKLLKNAHNIVHAGDPDREGQLLVDEVIDYCKVNKNIKSNIERLLINDLNISAIKKSLSTLKKNSDFIPLSVSALARSRADWLYGMNMTRGYTILGQRAGYKGVLSVGRVQTPLLGIIVRRDEEIENFIPKDYFTLDALIPYEDKKEKLILKARWKPSEACAKWLDDNDRVLSHSLAEHVAKKITHQPATVTDAVSKISKQNPPLPYSLSALQIDASKRFCMSAQHVLDACQSLYEKHKLITYPRSDCRYLPKDHFLDAPIIGSAIGNNLSALEGHVENTNFKTKSKAWDDKKVGAHHAIIPTKKKLDIDKLTKYEQNIYIQIATQYLIQFYPAAEYAEIKLTFDIEGGVFTATGKMLKKAGWKIIMGKSTSDKKEDITLLPFIKKGTELLCTDTLIQNKKTEPPKRFTEATLLQAMTGIAKFVTDTNLKKILKETDGLGTEATRAGIIETLMKRELLKRSGKIILSTEAARGLVHALPLDATTPDMTAHWEHQLQEMTQRNCSYHDFMNTLIEKINGLMQHVKNTPVPHSLRNLPPPKKLPFKRKVTRKKSAA